MTDLTNRDARRLTEEALRLQGQAAERQLELLHLADRQTRAMVDAGLAALEQSREAWEAATGTWLELVLPPTGDAPEA